VAKEFPEPSRTQILTRTEAREMTTKGALGRNYHTDVDTATADSWAGVIARFNGASLYQTWPYGAVRWGDRNMSSFLLRKGQEIAAAARVRLLRIPLIGRGIACV